MASIEMQRFDESDHVTDFGDAGRSEAVRIRDVVVIRSVLEPGWSWRTHIQPMTRNLESCPLHHREYVVAGRIRYEMADGEVIEADAGTYLDIPPGHVASVVGDETCVLIDWDEGRR